MVGNIEYLAAATTRYGRYRPRHTNVRFASGAFNVDVSYFHRRHYQRVLHMILGRINQTFLYHCRAAGSFYHFAIIRRHLRFHTHFNIVFHRFTKSRRLRTRHRHSVGRAQIAVFAHRRLRHFAGFGHIAYAKNRCLVRINRRHNNTRTDTIDRTGGHFNGNFERFMNQRGHTTARFRIRRRHVRAFHRFLHRSQNDSRQSKIRNYNGVTNHMRAFVYQDR